MGLNRGDTPVREGLSEQLRVTLELKAKKGGATGGAGRKVATATGQQTAQRPGAQAAWPRWEQSEAHCDSVTSEGSEVGHEATGSGVDPEHYECSGKLLNGFKKWIDTF